MLTNIFCFCHIYGLSVDCTYLYSLFLHSHSILYHTCCYHWYIHLLLQEYKLYNHKVSFLTTKSLEKNKNFGNLRSTLQKTVQIQAEYNRFPNKYRGKKLENILIFHIFTTTNSCLYGFRIECSVFTFIFSLFLF